MQLKIQMKKTILFGNFNFSLELNIDRSMFSKCFVRCSQCVALTILVNKDLKALLNLSWSTNLIKAKNVKTYFIYNTCTDEKSSNIIVYIFR